MHQVPLFHAQDLSLLRDESTGVVDEDVNSSPFEDSLRDKILEVRVTAHVCFDRDGSNTVILDDLVLSPEDGLLSLLLRHDSLSANSNVATSLGKLAGGSESNSSVATRDDGNLAFKVIASTRSHSGAVFILRHPKRHESGILFLLLALLSFRLSWCQMTFQEVESIHY